MMESSSFQPSVRRTTMKMARVSVVLVFLLCCSAVASQGCDQTLAEGQNFNVPLDNKGTSVDILKWKFNGTIICHRRNNMFVVGKADDINKDGSLKLTNLKKNESGLYVPEIFDQNGKSQTLKSTKLCVVDSVKKPKLTATCQSEKVKFVCELDQQPPDVTVEWFQNKGKITSKQRNVLEKKIAELKKDPLICKVSNKVSSAESEAVIQSCSITSFSCPLSIDGVADELCWGLIGGGGGIVLLLIIVVIFCCIRTKRTRKLRLQDEEELRLEWTNTNHNPNHPPLPDHPPPHHPNRHHHHHHHNHHQQQEQQQAPGNTGPRQSRSKQNRQPRARAPEPNGQPQPSPRRTGQPQKPASDADDEQPPPLPQPRKKGPKTQLD